MLIASRGVGDVWLHPRGATMVRFEISHNELIVTGRLRTDDVELLVDWGRGLFDGDSPEAVLDLRNAVAPSTTFVGAVAQMAMEARSKSKKLIVRATGRTADWLVWSGLHRVAHLDVEAPRDGYPLEREVG